MRDKKGVVHYGAVIGLVAVVFLGVIATLWFNNYLDNKPQKQLTITQTGTGSGQVTGADVGAGKLTATATFTTDDVYAIGTQPSCQSSLWITDPSTGKVERASSALAELGTYGITPGKVVTVQYCSNNTAATTRGWYEQVDGPELIGNTGDITANAKLCSWQTNAPSITVQNDPASTNNPATLQDVGSGGVATMHVVVKQTATTCFSTPDTGSMQYVARYDGDVWKTPRMLNVKVIRYSGGDAFSASEIPLTGQIPSQHKMLNASLTAVAFKIPTNLNGNDKLEFDWRVEAKSGYNPGTGNKAHINGTLYDYDWYVDTITGMLSGPAMEDDTGTDLGNNLRNANITFAFT